MTKKDLSTFFDRKSKTLYPSEFDSRGIKTKIQDRATAPSSDSE